MQGLLAAQKRQITLKFWVPVLLWASVIFIVSSIPGNVLPEIRISGIDLIIHALEYLILGILLIRALLNSGLNRNVSNLVIFAVIIILAYAYLDEWHQQFVPNRMPDALDLLSDFTGACIGISIYNKRGFNCR